MRYEEVRKGRSGGGVWVRGKGGKVGCGRCEGGEGACQGGKRCEGRKIKE